MKELFQQLYSGRAPPSLPAVGRSVAVLLQVFKHVLQYLRAVRDQQPFACAESLSRDQLAAIAAEAHFYGLADLERATLERNTQAEYEYKYFLTVDSGEGSSSRTFVYNPKVQIYPGCPNSKAVISWQIVGESARAMIPGTPPGATDLGADPGNLLHLHSEGWEPVQSLMTARANYESSFVVVLRRRL